MEDLITSVAPAPGTSLRVTIDERSLVGAARRAAVALGNEHHLSTDAVGRLAIVVTEAATNILRHAGHGVILLRALLAGSRPAIEVLALDKGPGIPDVARAMRDGYSTSGTAGQGLGGMQRLADVFEMHSMPGGTALLARVGERTHASSRSVHQPTLDDRLGVVCVPLRGETECGDAWRVIVGRQRTAILVVDGLGHGPAAAAAAAIATSTFEQNASVPPERALVALDAAMRGSRGAAASISVIDEAARTVRFSGVGNVDGRVLSGEPTGHLVPQNGIVGHTMPNARATDVAWPAGARLVMHSDGISTRWRVEAYGTLMTAHPALLAGIIFRDFGRDRDDATVLVLADPVAAQAT